jgi:LuxR family transcriptional regulator, maltose regulon positive regulatory protein
MPPPVLATKLFLPPPRPNAVLRAGLIARLNGGLHRKLTLIAAPAGFGKTSLASTWIRDCGRAAAWLSLDDADNDPSRFLAYLVATLQTIAPNIGADIVALLQSSQPPPLDALLPLLLNQIATLPQPAILVLDDYHVIAAAPIHAALNVLVERLPPQLHLVITTREDPPLPLPRLRARGQLTELRAADLRFTSAETAAFLNEGMGLSLTVSDITTLEERTEGWIAGLQLAALSLQGHQDVPSFIRGFAGDHRYIVDYLIEEVLQRLPEAVRSFLLQTAMLDRLCGSLCDAVTLQERGQAQLEALERGNFFVVPLDDRRHWYRYHHLFAEVLSAHLQAELPGQVTTLHQRASAWYERHGFVDDAIRHALAAQDRARAADLIELAVPAMRRSRQEATVLGWLKALPDDVLRRRPVLSAAYVWVLLARGELDGVEQRLRDAERWLDTATAAPGGPDTPESEMIVVDEAAFRQLPGALAAHQAAFALARGDLAGAEQFAQRAQGLAREDDQLWRGAAAAILGLAAWAKGDLAAAHRSYAEGMARLRQAGHISDAIGGAITLADIEIAQGRLHEATRTYERGLQLAADHGAPDMRGTADMYVGLSQLLCERGELQAATQHLLRSQEQGEHTGFPQHPYRWRVAMACVREAEGDLDGALALLDEAQRRYTGDFAPPVRPIAALKTRVWLAQGRVNESLGWARAQGLSAHDELSYLREFEHITLARVLLAQHARDGEAHTRREAVGLLGRLLQAAKAGERTGNVIEILVVQALAHQMRGDIPAALAALEVALALAAPEDYVRVFVREGPPMEHLLREALARGITPGYARRLLAVCSTDLQTPALPVPRTSQPLVEPLSQRELDVLRLLRTELSGPEIARELVIGLSTVRTYTKSIYGKLHVTSRRAAVNRAVELGLI